MGVADDCIAGLKHLGKMEATRPASLFILSLAMLSMNVSGQQLSTGSVKFDFLTVPLLLPASDDPARKLVEATEFTLALDGKGRSKVQHRYPSDGSENAQQQAFTHPVLGNDSKNSISVKTLRLSKPADFNREIYYRNKLEFSLETGWLPINIPFVFDFLVGSAYTTWPLHYTMVPNIASIRWHVDGIGGPSILRGNTDFTFSGSYTAIPRGARRSACLSMSKKTKR
jgi:hypothetical protein